MCGGILAWAMAYHNEGPGRIYKTVYKIFPTSSVIGRETLRKHQVIPHQTRQSKSDYRVPNTNLILERGMRIFIPIDAIHHDPEIYPEPDNFGPVRFTSEVIDKRHPLAYLPFGEGPRNCVGMRFGELQTFIGIIKLLRNFKFKPSSRTGLPIVHAKKNFLDLMVEKVT